MSTSFGSAGFGASAHLGDALSGLLDGELPESQALTARVHLAACPACTQEMLAVSQARSWVRTLPAVDPPFGFYERMLLDQTLLDQTLLYRNQVFASRTTLRRRAGLAALGAAAAAVTVLGVGSPSQAPVRSPGAPQLVQAHAANALAGADLMSKLTPVAVPVSFGR